MKRASSFLVAALLLAFLATPGFTQNLSAGVQGGIDLSNLSIDDPTEDVSLDSSLGFSGGAFFAVDLHEYFRLQFAGQYVQKGAEEEDVVDGVTATVEFNLAYLEFMVPATLTIPIENSPVTPRLFAGPAVGIELSCKIGGEALGVSVDIDCEELDINGGGLQTKSVDVGVLFGGGLDIALGAGAITLDVLYNLGLTDINDAPGAEDVSIKNQNIQFLAGYRFFFGA
ncbi:MAG: outer membrane beta-barrel protein [Gemmatimonadales bacterium]|nr:outer membrane beta-barrel protein [Gemmatimonadales bacterium]NIS64140.1 outer membrane beta-barrel protein [Gemmatimonadales bacterium]